MGLILGCKEGDRIFIGDSILVVGSQVDGGTSVQVDNNSPVIITDEESKEVSPDVYVHLGTPYMNLVKLCFTAPLHIRIMREKLVVNAERDKYRQ